MGPAAARDLEGLLAEARPHDVVGLRTAADPSDRLELDDAQSRRILASLADAVTRGLGDCPVRGLYTTGGDVTHAVTCALGAEGIEIIAEVLPMAVQGRLLGGPREGLPIVTKGGLVGGRDAAVVCLRSLMSTT
jgi:D-threonate/D-erythronate kinase